MMDIAQCCLLIRHGRRVNHWTEQIHPIQKITTFLTQFIYISSLSKKNWPNEPLLSTTATILSSVSIFNFAPCPVERSASAMSSFKLTDISLPGPVLGGDFGFVEERARDEVTRPDEMELNQ